MDRQSYQQTSRTYIPFTNTRTSSYGSKLANPEKKLSNDNVLKIFSEISSGNYLKIKSFLLENKLTLTSKNEKGESVLHLIISNSNITPQEKFQLVEYSIKEGAQVNSFDENNITPLHLASLHQLPQIIQFLIDNGANVNSKDSQSKTPLHYAVTGESTQCQTEEDTKVKPLIPKIHKNKKNKPDKILEDLQNYLKNFLVTDDDTKMYITHLKNTFEDLEDMYTEEIEDFLLKIKSSITNVLSYPSVDNKKQLIFEAVMNEKKKLLDFVYKKIGSGLSPLLIKPSQYLGWGPDSRQENRILEYKELTELLKDVKASAFIEKNELLKKSEELLLKITEKINALKKIQNNISLTIQHSHHYSRVLFINNKLYVRNLNTMGLPLDNFIETIGDEYVRLLFDDPCTPIDSPLIEFSGKIFPCYDNNGSTSILTYIIDNGPNPRILPELHPTSLPVYEYMQLPSCRTTTLNNVQTQRVNKSILQTLPQNIRNIIKEYPLTNERPIRIEDIRNIDPRNIMDLPVGPKTNPQTYSINNDDNTEGIYFDSRLKIYVEILIKLNEKINILHNSIQTEMDNHDFEKVFLKINEYLCMALSMLLTLIQLNDEKNKLINNLTNMRTYFGKFVDAINFKNYLWIPEQIIDEIESSISLSLEISDACEHAYGAIKEIVGILNKNFVLIQKLSVAEIFTSFYGDKTKKIFNDFYNEQNTDIITNIVNKPIKQINELPSDFSDFIKLKGANITETKKELIVRYCQQITTKNLVKFYKNVGPFGIKKPKIGFVKFLENDVYSLRNNPKEALKYVNTSFRLLEFKNLDLQINESAVANAGSDFENTDPLTLLGRNGILQSKQFDKKNAMPPVIGLEIGKHLETLRYSIVRHVITTVYGHITNPAPILPDPVQESEKFRKSINNFKNKIRSLVQFDENDHSFILVIIAKYIDNLLINIVKEIVGAKISKLSLKLLESIDKKTYSELLRDKIIIPNQDIGFTANLTTTFDEFLKMYASKPLYLKKYNSITVGNLNDPVVKKNNVVKLINFNYSINSLEQVCFKVDPNIIKLLLKNGAYVNCQDINLNSPIYYAVEMQNKQAIDILLHYGAVVYNPKFQNRFGKNVLDETWESYHEIVRTLMVNKYSVCDVLTKNLIEKIMKQGDHKNNIPKYSNVLLPISLYMLNHQLYIFGKGYPKAWSFEKNTKLENLLNLNTSQLLPLLDDISLFDQDVDSRLEIPNMHIENLKTEINEYKQKEKQINDVLTNLIKEQNHLNQLHQLTSNEMARLTEINDIINENTIQINQLGNKIREKRDILSSIDRMKNRKYESLKSFLNNNKNQLKRNTFSVTETYESVFKDVINNGNRNIQNYIYDFTVDTKTYPIIWKKFINQTMNKLSNCNCEFQSCSHDYTQILDNLFCYQQKILSSNEHYHIKLGNLTLVSEYYDNVISTFSNDYFDLPREYGTGGDIENYALTHVLNIIIHIVKRFICLNLYGTLLKGLTNFVFEQFPYSQENKMYSNETEYQTFILNIILSVINDRGDDINNDVGYIGVQGSRLLKYIFETAPTKIVKVVLQIFEGPESEYDQDRENSIEQILSHIINILESTPVLNLTPNNSLSSGLKQYVFPYYTDYLESFIKEIFNLLSNYLRSLQFQGKTLHILNNITHKAVEEMKKINHI